MVIEEEWQKWKSEHGKSYADDVEESIRRAVWFRTYYHVKDHNSAAENMYELGLNSLADLVSC